MAQTKSLLGASVTPVTLTLYIHDGDANGPTIPDAQVTGHDGSGNNFQQTTNSNGYVIINGDPGTWSFSASASGYAINNWDQEITDTCTKQASLQKEQQSSENSVVGKWAFHSEEVDVKRSDGGGIRIASQPPDSIIDFKDDGTLIRSQIDPNGIMQEYNGEWFQSGDTIRFQYNPAPIRESKPVEGVTVYNWQTEGATYDGTINGATMSGTGSSVGHTKLIDERSPNGSTTFDTTGSYTWSANRVDTGESASPSAGENEAQGVY